MNKAKNAIESGTAVLGIEFGSTRIKAILVDEIGRASCRERVSSPV